MRDGDDASPVALEPYPVDVHRACSQKGCLRAAYLGALCKRHADEEHYRQESIRRRDG